MAWKQLLAIGLCSASASAAHAHISLEEGGTHMSRSGDAGDAIKNGPCGGGTRGANVYTYRPGETINITVAETVPHPGYFRIAFDADGDDDFESPSGTDGADGSCGFPTSDPACGPGKEDYCNNETVLLDHLSQHSSAEAQATYTFSVTLPNVECDNCTLQIIQMMNDLAIHFAPYPADDIYYQCIDLVLSNDAPDVNDAPVTNNGMVCPGGGGGAGTGGAGGAAGGTGGAAGGSGMGGMSGVGGAAGGGATSGGGAGMPGEPIAGAGAGSGAGGAGGAAGATGGAGAAAPLPPVMMPTGTGSPSSSADEGGCRAASGAATSSAGAIGLALLALAARRRRLRS